MTEQQLVKQTQAIADHYGLANQMSIAQEECAELIQALSKLRRAGEWPTDSPERRVQYIAARNLVSEEMADVLNLISQLTYLLDNDAVVMNYLATKLSRTLRDIEEEQHET